jgi:hypothetical protein
MTGIKRAERVNVRGIGRKNSRLLQEAGIDRLGQLLDYEHSPSSLRARLAAANSRAGVVQRLPTEGMVRGWISQGSALVSSGKATKNSRLARHSRLAGPPITPPPKGGRREK